MTDRFHTQWAYGVPGALLFILVVAAALGAAAPPAGQEGSGSKKTTEVPAPKPMEILDAEHYRERVADYHGRPLMVTFWATWCEPCRDEFPMVIELARQYAPKGLSTFAMNLDDDAEEPLARRFLARTQPPFPNFRKKPGKEEEFINGVNSKWSGALPATFFYTPDGRLMGQLVGEQKREAFVSAIEQLLAASPPK